MTNITNTSEAGFLKISLVITALILGGCAVKPLKAPCSWDEGQAAAAAFPFTGKGPEKLFPVGELAPAKGGVAEGSHHLSLDALHPSNADACGPIRQLNLGSQAWQ